MVYRYTSPIEHDYIKRKIMMFSIPVPAMSFNRNISEIQNFDDIKINSNVIYAIESKDP